MKNFVVSAILSLILLQTCFAPPVTKDKEKDKSDEEAEVGGLEDYMEYHRYLKEVVSALESDPDFRNKLEKANESDIRSGKIAEELEFVSHHVRTRLDEIKRVELNRLKELIEKKKQLQENVDNEDPNHRHLDHSNPHTFEIDDLKKLIAKTTEDLAEADRKRREEFKEYELQKEYDKQLKLNHTEEAERQKLEKEFREREEKHKKHEKLHEPGHKAQLEEVWQEQDQMQQEFDPKTFFMLHDLDSNGFWDQDEVKALFVKELQKMYAAGEPEDDMRERAEEMERMRESVFKEVDLNRDGFIDYDEFLAQTKRNDFQQDHGWQGLDERRPYTDEELEEYIRRHQSNEIPQGHHPGPYYQGPPQQFHPGQLPPQHPQQLHGNLPPLNTNEVYPHQVQQPPQGYQQHPQAGYQQPPPQHGNYQQMPPQHQQQQVNYQPPPPQQQANYQQPPPQQQQANYQPQPPQQQANYQPQPPQQPPQQQVNNQQQPPQQQQQRQVNYQQQNSNVVNNQQNQPPVNNQGQPHVNQV